MSITKHTVGVETLRDIPGYERAHPAITAVIERADSHIKVCATSKPVSENPHVAVGPVTIRRAGSVHEAMTAVAKGIALTYGATYVEAASR